MFRATSQQAGNRWMKAINLSFQSSKQIIRNDLHSKKDLNAEVFNHLLDDEDINIPKDEHEIERHFIDQDLTDDQNSSVEQEYHSDRSSDSNTTAGSVDNDYSNRNSETKNKRQTKSQSDDKSDKNSTIKRQPRRKIDYNNISSQSSQQDNISSSKRSHKLIFLKQSPNHTNACPILQPDQTEYIYIPEEQKFNEDHNQDSFSDENKSLIWTLLKQVGIFLPILNLF